MGGVESRKRKNQEKDKMEEGKMEESGRVGRKGGGKRKTGRRRSGEGGKEGETLHTARGWLLLLLAPRKHSSELSMFPIH